MFVATGPGMLIQNVIFFWPEVLDRPRPSAQGFTGVGEVKRLLEVPFQRSESYVCNGTTSVQRCGRQMANTTIHMTYGERPQDPSLTQRHDDASHPLQPIIGQTSCLPHFLLRQEASQHAICPSRSILHHLSIRSDLHLTAGRLCTGMSVCIYLNHLVFL